MEQMEHIEQFPSLNAMLAHIEATRDKDGNYRTISHNGSQVNRGTAGSGIPLAAAVSGARTLSWDGLHERIATIETLARALTGSLPAGVSVRRVPQWQAQGARVNIHRVLNGNLAHAWRSTIRVAQVTPGMGRLVILLPATMTAHIAPIQIQWSAIATLALADYARRQGRAIEIWSLGWHNRVFESGHHYIWLVPLQRAGESWHSEMTVLATYPEWLRRFGFRLLEQAGETHGAFFAGYGHGVASEQELLGWAQNIWAPAQGIPAACIQLGATQGTQVRDAASAARWLASQVAQVAQGAAA